MQLQSRLSVATHREPRVDDVRLASTAGRWRRRLGRGLLALVGVLVVLLLSGALWVRHTLNASLPQLDGERRLAGLSNAVTVSRDELGIPVIRGRSRADVARATGFVHAQDRFFQMDVSRRRAAGELAELLGPTALPLDRVTRIHRFRDEARRAVALMQPDERALLEAYAAGVNSGLLSLSAPPFEYAVLRQAPARWTVDDSLLVVLSMYLVLQSTDGSYERSLAAMHEVLPAPVADFLAPRSTEWDASIDGDAGAMPPIPARSIFDLRAAVPPRSERGNAGPGPAEPSSTTAGARSDAFVTADAAERIVRQFLPTDSESAVAVGSNSWVVAGGLTRSGTALLANDIHLGIRVPNTWYRAAFEWPSAAGGTHRVSGVTLPGVPPIIVGSNGNLAWGFTNSFADTSDVIRLETEGTDRYRTPTGVLPFQHYDEVIKVARRPEEHYQVTWTTWGPVLDTGNGQRRYAYAWLAHRAELLATSLHSLEEATGVEQAFGIVNGIGAPAQNMVAADREGHIGWSIYGALPKREGFDGRLPVSWADGARKWAGPVASADYPRRIDPAAGRLWTANARVIGGAAMDAVGDGNYELGTRATIIRDRLQDRHDLTPPDFLALQLDTSATFLARWRELLLRVLTADAVRGRPEREALRAVVAARWSGHAQPDDPAYRLTREWRDEVARRVFEPVVTLCRGSDPAFDYTVVRRYEGPLWALVQQQPMHWLAPQYDRWDALLLDAADALIARMARDFSGPLTERVWSEYNVLAYEHPLSRALPVVGRRLNMPFVAIPGDVFTVRVHLWGAAASMRMVVAPGHESEGILEMPTGQSGHPLSPFYANSHPAWVRGEATPFLPGAPVHSLVLQP